MNWICNVKIRWYSVFFSGFSVVSASTMQTQIMADEFNSLWSEIQNYIAEADADLIPVPGQLEWHGRCR